jgi:hypothetical protein
MTRLNSLRRRARTSVRLAFLAALRARTCACRRTRRGFGGFAGVIPEQRLGLFLTILDAVESTKPLKTNGSKKRRNHRRKSSFIVKTGHNPLILLKN